MSVLDAYKKKCENCSKAKIVCTKHFYIYCADSKLEEYYNRDKKAYNFFTKKNQETTDLSVVSSTSSTPTVITSFSNDEIVPEVNSGASTPHN